MKQTKEEFVKRLRNYVQARDELLTFTTAFGCNTPAGETLGAALHIYGRRGAPRKFIHSMMDDEHVDYVVGYWSPYEKKVFNSLREAGSYLTEHPYGDSRDVIYEAGKIGGIEVYSMYTKEEVLKILKEEEN